MIAVVHAPVSIRTVCNQRFRSDTRNVIEPDWSSSLTVVCPRFPCVVHAVVTQLAADNASTIVVEVVAANRAPLTV